MSNLVSFAIGMGMGFLLNFPPRKVQLVIVGVLIVFVIAAFAFLVDSGFSDWSWDWVSTAFNVAGYAIGHITAWGAKQAIGVKWK